MENDYYLTRWMRFSLVSNLAAMKDREGKAFKKMKAKYEWDWYLRQYFELPVGKLKVVHWFIFLSYLGGVSCVAMHVIHEFFYKLSLAHALGIKIKLEHEIARKLPSKIAIKKQES